MTTDLAITAMEMRQRGAVAGARGPHLNLFQGSLSVKKTAPQLKSVAERVEIFATARKLSVEATSVLRVIVEHNERTGEPFEGDGFQLSELSAISYLDVHKAKAELHMRGAVRTRSGNAFGIDGLVLGDAWNRQ